jgi:hypothetical protein
MWSREIERNEMKAKRKKAENENISWHEERKWKEEKKENKYLEKYSWRAGWYIQMKWLSQCEGYCVW